MKIVFVVTGLNSGGAEMMLYNLLLKINKKKFNPIVICLRDKGFLGDKISELNVPIHYLRINKFNLILSLIKLKKNLVKIQPDLIQGWMYHGNLISEFANFLLLNYVNTVWSIHHSIYSINKEKWSTNIVIRLLKLLSSKPKKILYVSHTSAKQHEKIGYSSEKTLIIPNGFDLQKFQPLSLPNHNKICSELKLTSDTILIGLIARYHPMKDHNNFLQAGEIIKKNNPQVHLILVGKQVDNSNEQLLETINALGIKDCTHLLGEREDVSDIIPCLNILSTASSYGEAFPLVVGEAMSCGVPCVVTNIGDSAWLVGDTGKIVPTQNPEALAKAWQELIDLNEEEKILLAKKTRKRIIDNFSLDFVVNQYENLYLSLDSKNYN